MGCSGVLAAQVQGPGLDPQDPSQKPVVVMCACDPSTGEVDTGGSLGLVGWLVTLN